eukprot:Rhum_TRINITY_DN15478_c1_g1::Rhum_TRINITY_DN15478_c1_g1_i2::g.160478::m.160478
MPADTDYVKATRAASPTKGASRPYGHAVRSFVLLIGIWFYFLFVACIPESKSEHEQILVSIGSGMVQGCAFIFVFFTMYGLRRTANTRMAAICLVAMYCLGGVLLAAGRGKEAKYAWNGTKNYAFSDKTYLRVFFIGRLIGEVAYSSAGLLIILPDLGFMADWE